MILPQSEVESLWDVIEAKPDTQITVDLAGKKVSYDGKEIPFEIDDYSRWRLMEGLDDIGLTLQHVDKIAAFEEKRPVFKPKTLPIK